MKLIFLFVILIFGSVGLCQKKRNFVCKDESGKVVDWFYMYKLPRNKFSRNPLIKAGVAYLYLTPDTLKDGWTLSTRSINDTSSIPGNTLSPLYKDSGDRLAIIYNDQPPEDPTKEPREDDDDKVETTTKKRGRKPSTTTTTPVPTTTKKPWWKFWKRGRRDVLEVQKQASVTEYRRRVKNNKSGGGHTKGVVLGDGTNGMWLVHSVPKFPPIPDAPNSVAQVSYSYPNTAMRYGQSFLCMSLKASELDQVGLQLTFNEPKILYSRVPKSWERNYGNILSVIKNMTVTKAPWTSVTRLTTLQGVPFFSFAKSGNFKDDLYDGLVATELKSDLFVESWINGPGVLPSNCSVKYKVNNVEKVAFHDKGVAFSSHSDHSKWAVTAPGNTKKRRDSGGRWTCIGDINRAESQELRGGGTVCSQNNDIWRHYSEAINELQPCQINGK